MIGHCISSLAHLLTWRGCTVNLTDLMKVVLEQFSRRTAQHKVHVYTPHVRYVRQKQNCVPTASYQFTTQQALWNYQIHFYLASVRRYHLSITSSQREYTSLTKAGPSPLEQVIILKTAHLESHPTIAHLLHTIDY